MSHIKNPQMAQEAREIFKLLTPNQKIWFIAGWAARAARTGDSDEQIKTLIHDVFEVPYEKTAC